MFIEFMKKLGVVALVFVSLVLLSTFVSAQGIAGDIQKVIDKVSEAANPIAKFFVGDIDAADLGGLSAGEALFAKVLVFFIVLTIVSLAVRTVPRIGDSKGVSFLVSLLVTMLGVRYITSGSLIKTIWLPSGALGVALAAFLPFVIFFFFMQGFESAVFRKVGWTAFLVIFFGLAVMRWSEFAVTGSFNGAWLYVIVAGLSLLMFLFDKSIHAMMVVQGLMKVTDANKRIEAANVVNEIDKLRTQLRTTNDTTARNDILKKIGIEEKKIKDILRS